MGVGRELEPGDGIHLGSVDRQVSHSRARVVGLVELGAQIELAGPAVTGYQCEGQAGESEVASPEV